jgi:hypothetical protein
MAGSAAAVPGRLVRGAGLQNEWNYFWVLWPLLFGLAVAGMVLAARPRWGRPAAVVAALLAAQVCGHGIVAVRDWFNTAGASGGMRLAVVVGLPAALALGPGFTAVTMVGQFALTYSLPWGAGLVATGWLGRRGRVAALTAVALSALLVATEFALRFPAVS